MPTDDAFGFAQAGLALITDANTGCTTWQFRERDAAVSPVAGQAKSAAHVCVSASRQGGVGLFAARNFAKGDLLLRERWLVGMPLGDKGCSQCLRVCAFNPAEGAVGVGCTAGCGARYCGPECRATAWAEHHQLLCMATNPAAAAPSVHPFEVFRKHARLAPSAIGQKAEDAQLAARILAM